MSNRDPRSDTIRGGTLIVFPGALGDFICLLPALDRVCARDERVTVLCRHDLVALVRASGLGDALPIEGRWLSTLFQREAPVEAKKFFTGFDRVESFSGADSPEVAANLARWLGPAARVHRFRPATSLHLADYYLECVGAPASARAEPRRLSLAAGTDEAARERLRRLPRPLLVIHPGSGGRAKRWSRPGFAAVAERWRARSGVDAAVVLGPAEAGEREWWSRHVRHVADDLDVVTLGAWLEDCSLYLGNDSGASHLAGAVGARGVALFGVTDPSAWRPRSARISALQPRPWQSGDEPASAAAIDAVESALLAAGSLP